MIGVTGYRGRLGSELIKLGCTPLDCDITSKKSIKQALQIVEPDMIIHCAAKTNVDACEDCKDEAFEINARGTENLKVCFYNRIIYISTDYIFDGKKGNYMEYAKPGKTEDLCWYGYTKLIGEQVLGNCDTIIRTTMLYGSPAKEDFVQHVLQKLELGEPFKVTRAFSGTPTYVVHLAEAIMDVVKRPFMPHIINIAGTDLYNRYEFAHVIASVFGYEDRKDLIEPTMKVGSTKRPRQAGLNTSKAKVLDVPIYSAVDGLKAYKEQLIPIYKQLRMTI